MMQDLTHSVRQEIPCNYLMAIVRLCHCMSEAYSHSYTHTVDTYLLHSHLNGAIMFSVHPSNHTLVIENVTLHAQCFHLATCNATLH